MIMKKPEYNPITHEIMSTRRYSAVTISHGKVTQKSYENEKRFVF